MYLVTPQTKEASSSPTQASAANHASAGFMTPTMDLSPFPVQHFLQQKELPSNQWNSGYQAANQASATTPFTLERLCRNLSLVSKQWKVVVGVLMNAHAPTKIIMVNDLYQLKCRALTLDLESICQDFIETIKDKWGRILIEGYNDAALSALELIVSEYGATEEGFANIVATEYVKFLIVKSVETLVCNKAYRKETRLVQVWKEPCQPPGLVKLFWRMHILSPKKYAHDCNALLGNLLGETNSIDNILECSVEAWYPIEGSDYESKRDALFQFESNLLCTNAYFGRFGDYGSDSWDLFEESFNVRAMAAAIWEKY
jgi:hypothetical protein